MIQSNPLVLLNFAICLAGLWMCICRARFMKSKVTKPAIRHAYTLNFTILMASAVSPLYDYPVNLTQVILTAGTVLHMLLGYKVWRHGQPDHARILPRHRGAQ